MKECYGRNAAFRRDWMSMKDLAVCFGPTGRRWTCRRKCVEDTIEGMKVVVERSQGVLVATEDVQTLDEWI